MGSPTVPTSAAIRQGFLDFFREKQHTIVPSSSLLPDAPNLLFTNAGMNQFVPIFLGKAPCPYNPGRAADTQKCIRAGGKHNDLEDVGFDTYHHTFFEMLGNWSFGDYFKKEAIAWAWELVVGRWGFPPERLYATVYKPSPGDPADADAEARAFWTEVFTKAGLDPAIHIVDGGKKDNFWMMGDTGPCGPCSEIHVNLKPQIDPAADRVLVNGDDARIIEIWNLVFIQFNADGQGGYTPLPAKHVDTGMGFERVASIIQGTKNFSDFSGKISNYETDVFRPLFDALEKLSGKTYASTLPKPGQTELSEQEKVDVAFRVIADHARTLSFAIADGITPSNEGRGYVLRRILRRAVRYIHGVGIHEPFLYQLTDVLAETMGEVFPEIRERQAHVERTIRVEEESFHKTLDRGIRLFEKALEDKTGSGIPGATAFELYDTYGFPLDLTQLMARERGLSVDVDTFETLMEEQRERARASQKKEVIAVEAAAIADADATEFVGFETLEDDAPVVTVADDVLVVERTPFYAAMGGQVGDTGEVVLGGERLRVTDTQKSADGAVLHKLDRVVSATDSPAHLVVDAARRARIEAHHTVTHILHWALREVLGKHVSQKGSYVGPDRLRFDFSHGGGMTAEEIETVERLVNEHIGDAEMVEWKERPYAEVQGDASIMQFFGDKYGEVVRVVCIGDGYSKELCGGTHVRNTEKIGHFKLLSEGAIAAGIRRVEAASGQALLDHVLSQAGEQEARHAALRAKKEGLDALTAMSDPIEGPAAAWAEYTIRREELERLEAEVREWEKAEAKRREANAASAADDEAASLITGARDIGGVPLITARIETDSPAYLQALAAAFKKAQWSGVAVLGAEVGGKGVLVACVSPDHTKTVRAGDIIKEIAPLIGGRGGGKPELAQGGGPDGGNLPAALDKVEGLWG